MNIANKLTRNLLIAALMLATTTGSYQLSAMQQASVVEQLDSIIATTENYKNMVALATEMVDQALNNEIPLTNQQEIAGFCDTLANILDGNATKLAAQNGDLDSLIVIVQEFTTLVEALMVALDGCNNGDCQIAEVENTIEKITTLLG